MSEAEGPGKHLQERQILGRETRGLERAGAPLRLPAVDLGLGTGRLGFLIQMVFMNKIQLSEPCIKIIKWRLLGLRRNLHNVSQRHHLFRKFLTGWPGFKLKGEWEVEVMTWCMYWRMTVYRGYSILKWKAEWGQRRQNSDRGPKATLVFNSFLRHDSMNLLL